MSKIGAISTKGCQQRWEMEKPEVESRIWQCQPAMCKIISDKLKTTDILLVSFVVNEISDIFTYAFSPTFKILSVKHDEWESYREPETKQQIIYIGWYNSHPMRKLIEAGVIRKEAVILLMGKDKDFEYLYKKNFTINIWMNCEGDLGFKFPDCDKWHTVIHTPMGVTDSKVTFDKKSDNCCCGYKGATFDIVSEQ